MARIQITDLPLLEDLTPEQLQELFGAGAKAFKPTFEALEDRQLMSASSLLGAAQLPTLSAATPPKVAQEAVFQPIKVTYEAVQQTSVQQTDPIAAVLQNPLAHESDSIGIKSPTAGVTDQVFLVANFTNVRFALTDTNGNAHQLQIQTLDIQGAGHVGFTGLWDSEKVTGYMNYDAARNVSISFKTDQLFRTPDDGDSYPDYSFSGTISAASQGYHIEGSYIDFSWYILGAAPVHVAGDQTFPTSDTIQQQDPRLAAAFSQLTQQGPTNPNPNQFGLPAPIPADPGIVPAPSTLLAADSAPLATDPVAPVPLPADPSLAAQVQMALGEVKLDQPV